MFLISNGALSWGPAKRLVGAMPSRTSESTIARISAGPGGPGGSTRHTGTSSPTDPAAPVITAQLFHILQQIRDSGVTIFIVEQNVQTTLQIADHGYVLDQGKVVLQGPGTTLANEPRIRAAYLGM